MENIKRLPIHEKFDEWNEEKKQIENTGVRSFFKERDIFYIRAGKNIGFEQNGKGEKFARPFIILKKFNKETFWGVPLSTKTKEGKYYHPFVLNTIPQTALLSQIKLVDAKRMLDKIGMVDQTNFDLIKQKIKNLL